MALAMAWPQQRAWLITSTSLDHDAVHAPAYPASSGLPAL